MGVEQGSRINDRMSDVERCTVSHTCVQLQFSCWTHSCRTILIRRFPTKTMDKEACMSMLVNTCDVFAK